MSKRKARQLSGLPATIEEAETAQLEAAAVAYARSLIRGVKSGEIKFGAPLDNLPPGLNPFDKTSGGFAGAAVLKEQALRDPEVMMSLFDLARAGFAAIPEHVHDPQLNLPKARGWHLDPSSASA